MFPVAREESRIGHRLEAVVASSRPGVWYERVVVHREEAAESFTATCTCTTETEPGGPQCAHVAAALLMAGGLQPALLPGRRRAEEPPQIRIASSSVQGDWLDLQVTVEVEGHQVNFSDLFTALVRGEQTFVLPGGTYFPLDTLELTALREMIEEATALNRTTPETVRVNRYQVDLWSDLQELETVHAADNPLISRIAELTGGVQELTPPPGFTAALRDYQQQGYSWLCFLHEHQLGGILADDMGLGKTVQAIAMMQRVVHNRPRSPRDTLLDHRPFLVIAPTSVVHNWEQEVDRFAPQLKTVAVTETSRRRGESLEQAVSGADVVLTSYALFRLDAQQYQALTWEAVLLDEAQMIKNPGSQSYRAVRDLGAACTVALTGTPMENSLMELWALVSLCCPGLLGAREQFQQIYRVPIEQRQDAEVLERLQRRLKPFLLRRTKDRVAKELPAKQEQVIRLQLDPAHRELYQRYLQRERSLVLGLLEGGGTSHRFEVLSALNRLRQLALDAELIGEMGLTSVKLETLQRMLPEIIAEGHRVLVLSQYTRFLSKARAVAEEAGVSTSYLDGSTTHRRSAISRFRTGKAEAFFISLKAGGFGLNLVEADYVILLDPWWNPAAEDQAVDRAHRIGQHRAVMVYRMIAEDTIEEKVMALQQSKRDLFDAVLDSTEGAAAAALSAEEIRELLE